MKELVEMLAQQQILEKSIGKVSLKHIFYTIIILYFFFIILIFINLFFDVFIDFSKVAEIQTMITSFGVVVALMTILLLTYKAEEVRIEKVMMNDEERLLSVLYEHPKKTKEELKKILQDDYERGNIDDNIFNKLKSTTAKTVGTIRKKHNLGPLIQKDTDERYSLTTEGSSYLTKISVESIKDNLRKTI